MSELKAAIIGCGRPGGATGATGSGISHAHAEGYKKCPDTKLSSLADIVLENAQAFQAKHGADTVYTDYREMLEKEKPDLVSICTWSTLHAQMVIDCAEAKVPAVHCEKPMAPTWAEAKRMVAACEASGTQLTINHQRRFDLPYMEIRKRIQAGRIGELKRMEFATDNLYDWGTHWFDMMHFFNEEASAEWVLAQVEPTGGPSFFGVTLESQGVTSIKFKNDVRAVMLTGNGNGWGALIRLTGTEGQIELGATGWDKVQERIKGQSDWVDFTPETPKDDIGAFGRAFSDIASALRGGPQSTLSVDNAIRATELIFAAYESSRQGGRVQLPLEVADAKIRVA